VWVSVTVGLWSVADRNVTEAYKVDLVVGEPRGVALRAPALMELSEAELRTSVDAHSCDAEHPRLDADMIVLVIAVDDDERTPTTTREAVGLHRVDDRRGEDVQDFVHRRAHLATGVAGHSTHLSLQAETRLSR